MRVGVLYFLQDYIYAHPRLLQNPKYQSHRCSPENAFEPLFPTECPEKTQIRLHGCIG